MARFDLEAIKAKLDEIVKDATGEARREVEAMLADAKSAEEAIIARAHAFKPELDAALAAATPEIRAAVMKLAETLVADIEAAVSGSAVVS